MQQKENLKVVYHVAAMGNWREVVAEQLGTMAGAGIATVDVSLVGPGLLDLVALGERYGIELHPVAASPNLKLFESPALLWVEELARTSTVPILYLHTKGVSRPGHEGKAAWRRLMMAELVAPWREHLGKLDQFDCCGLNWQSLKPHFSGNFWIARPAYLRTLPHFKTHFRKHDRFSCEWWIGKNKSCKPLSLVCKNLRWWGDDFDFVGYVAKLANTSAYGEIAAKC